MCVQMENRVCNNYTKFVASQYHFSVQEKRIILCM